MKKRILCVLLAALLVCSALPSRGYAAETASGELAPGMTWTLDGDGVLTVSGTGAMPDFSCGEAPWYGYCQSIRKVCVLPGITHVGNDAFYGLTALTEAELPAGLLSIGEEAFQGCSGLTELTVPDTVTAILRTAFMLCTRLKQVHLPEGLQILEPSVFAWCSSLERIVLPAGIGTVSPGLCSDCTSLREAVISDGITMIGGMAFSGCTALTGIFIPKTVTEISTEAFVGSTALTEISYEGTEEEWSRVTILYGSELQTEAEISFDACRHEYGPWEPADEVSHQAVCTLCGQRGEQTHLWTESTVLPGCTEQGYLNHACNLCGYHYGTDFTDPVGHRFGSWNQTVPSTETAAGEERRDCADCDHYEVRPVPMNLPLPEQTPAAGDNRNRNFYTLFYSNPTGSVLGKEEGGYCRVEWLDGALTVEKYDENLQFLSRRAIPLELPLYGGVYLGEEYNFVICGQENPSKLDSTEVYRIVRYTKDWVRTGSCSIYGADTFTPFYVSGVDFTAVGDVLYIRTGRQWYGTADRSVHQANFTCAVRMSDLELVVDGSTDTMNRYGYVSHSLDQHLAADGTDLLAVDLGDAFPRAAALYRIDTVSPSGGTENYVRVLPIAQSTGHYNYTGVSLGGLEVSSTHYLVAGNSADQSGGIDFVNNQRNVFVTATPKSDFTAEATQQIWLTDYPEGADVKISPPYLVKVSADRFLLLWSEDMDIRYCFLNGAGQPEGEICSAPGMLSDCEPVLDGDRVLWYVTAGGPPVFRWIALEDPAGVESSCSHDYREEKVWPTCQSKGYTALVCALCGDTDVQEYVPRKSHDTLVWFEQVPPTCWQMGEDFRYCYTCGYLETRIVPATGLHIYEGGVCTVCGTMIPEDHVFGDASGDGEITVRDLAMLRKYLANKDPVSGKSTVEVAVGADAGGDGEITVRDLAMLRKYLANKDPATGDSSVVLGPRS